MVKLGFVTILNEFLVSDWETYSVPSCETFSEDTSLNIENQISKKIFDVYCQLFTRHIEKGLTNFNELPKLIIQCESFNFLFDYHLLKAQIFILQYQIKDAFESLLSIKTSLFSSQYDTYDYSIRRVNFFKLLARVYFELKEPELALEQSFKGIHLSEKYHFVQKTYELHFYNSSMYMHTGDIPKANDSVNICLNIALKLEDSPKQIVCFSSLSSIAQVDGNFQKGIEYAKKGLQLARKPHSDKLILCVTNLSNLYWRIGYLKEANPLLLESRQLALKRGNKRYLFSIYNNLGLFFVTKGNYEKALSFFKLALQVNLNTNYDIQLPYIYTNFANLYYEMNDLELAESYFLKTLEISEKTKNLPFQIDSLTNLILIASLKYKRDKIDLLLTKLSSIIKLSTGTNDKYKYELAQGFTFEISNSLEELKKAQKIFKKLMGLELSDFDIINTAYLHYCRTIFKSFIDFNLKIEWVEIEKLLEALQSRAKALHLFNTYSNAIILISKILCLDGKYEKAEKMLLEILEEAEIRGFDLVQTMTQESLDILQKIKFGDENIEFESFLPNKFNQMIENDIIKFIEKLA